MKKILLVIALALGTQCYGQNVLEENVNYGTVKSDGYQKVTKKAFWAVRPEAKIIYSGETVPDGYTVYILQSDHFGRFGYGENNQNDKNYIVIPKGEKVYKDCNGQYYAAVCGNRFEYLQPVGAQKMETKKEFKEKEFEFEKPQKKDVIFVEPKAENYFPAYQYKQQEVPTKVCKKNGWIVPVVVGIIATGVTYALLSKNKGGGYQAGGDGNPKRDQDHGIPADPRTMPGGIGMTFSFGF